MRIRRGVINPPSFTTGGVAQSLLGNSPPSSWLGNASPGSSASTRARWLEARSQAPGLGTTILEAPLRPRASQCDFVTELADCHRDSTRKAERRFCVAQKRRALRRGVTRRELGHAGCGKGPALFFSSGGDDCPQPVLQTASAVAYIRIASVQAYERFTQHTDT